jgi:hypothetical protein
MSGWVHDAASARRGTARNPEHDAIGSVLNRDVRRTDVAKTRRVTVHSRELD